MSGYGHALPEGFDPSRTYSLRQLAEMFGCSQRTLERRIEAKRFPPPDFRLVGGYQAPRWLASTIAAYRESGDFDQP